MCSSLSLMLSLIVNRTDQGMVVQCAALKKAPIINSGAHGMSEPCSSCAKLAVSIASSIFNAQPPGLDTREKLEVPQLLEAAQLQFGWPPTVLHWET